MLRSLLAFCGFLATCTVVSLTGIIFEPGIWYVRLNKPAFTPPNWLFPPVWSVLYLMIAVSGWLVWRKMRFSNGDQRWTFYYLQLALNATWSALFFGLHFPGLAFAEIVLLWFAIMETMKRFTVVSKLAGLLLVPYVLWVSYAAVLNFTIWQMN